MQPAVPAISGSVNSIHGPPVTKSQPQVQSTPSVQKTTAPAPVSQPQEKPMTVQPTPPVLSHPQTRSSVSLSNVAPVPKKIPTSNSSSSIQLPLDNAYTDPLEHSLASLEQDMIKSEGITSPLSNISSIPAIPNIPNINPTHQMPMMGGNMMPTSNSLMHPMHSTIDTNEMAPVIPPITTSTNMLHSNNNGFGTIKSEIDLPMNNNGLSMGMNIPPLGVNISSIFDPLPSVTQSQQMPMNSMGLLPVKKEEKPLIHPKPLEELSNPSPIVSGNMNNSTDKKMTPPEQKAANFASAFKPKQEQNIKNASSWSSLAQANSPQNSSTGVSNRQVVDSFQQFKKQAKEKADRQKALLEQQEMRRQQKEQAEKERLRAETERRREKEEEEALEKARLVLELARHKLPFIKCTKELYAT